MRAPIGILILLFAILGGTFSSSAEASTIKYSSRPIVSTASGSAQSHRQNWLDALAANPIAPSGYGDAFFTEFYEASNQSQGPSTQNINGTNRNLSEHFSIRFFVSPKAVGSWDFRFQNDFGYGGAVFINGLAVDFKDIDLHGQDPLGIFYISTILGVGFNTIDIYGQEGCCDGYQYGHFKKPGSSDYVVFSDHDHLSPVPLPPTAFLMLSGFIGLAGFNWQRKRKKV